MKYLLFILGLIALPALVFAADTTGTGFVPLTNVPFLQEAGNSLNLTQFLNGIYRLSIGVAAVVAVVQIMRAGIIYMGGDSFTEKKEAKSLIALAIGGLVLVLSPVVVFSVINPEILSLKITGIEKLKVDTPAGDPANVLWVNTSDPYVKAAADCVAKDKGTPVAACKKTKDGEVEPYTDISSCYDATKTATFCMKSTTGTTTGLSKTCTDYKQTQAAISVCDGGKDFVQIDKSCCGSLGNGAVCCGSTQPPTPTWGWRGKFYPEATPSQVATRQQGPFTSQEACNTSLRDWPAANKQMATGDFVCDCNKPLSEQSGCNNF